MECYYHEDRSACGICKSCQRGICRDCASEVSNGIACKASCETQAAELDAMITFSKNMEEKSSLLINSVGIGTSELFNIVLGSLFFGFGLYEDKEFIMYLGIAFLVFGALGIIRYFRAKGAGNA